MSILIGALHYLPVRSEPTTTTLALAPVLVGNGHIWGVLFVFFLFFWFFFLFHLFAVLTAISGLNSKKIADVVVSPSKNRLGFGPNNVNILEN